MTREQEINYLKAAAQGDASSFEALFFSYHPRMVAFLTGFIKEREAAKDIAQDIFFNLWNQRERLGEVRSLTGYLFRMARNAALNYYERDQMHGKYERSQRPLPASNLAEDTLLLEDINSLIEAAVARMPPQRNLIYSLSREKGMTNQEISQFLNISQRTVENHLSLALSDIRRVLEPV